MRSRRRHCQAQGDRLGIYNDYTHSPVEVSRCIVIHTSPHMPATNPSSQDWERCCSSHLEEKPSLNCVFTTYTWKDSLYSSSSPEARRTQRNTTVGKDLIPRTDLVTSRPQTKEPATKHTFSEEPRRRSSWMSKNERPRRSLGMEVCAHKLSSATQTQECWDNPWPTAEGGDGHLLSSLPRIP